MFSWVEAMPLIEKIFFFIALPASLFMVIQTISLFIGGAGDSGLDSDTSGIGDGMGDVPDASDMPDLSDVADGDFDNEAGFADNGLRFVTTRGIVTFMTVFGWAGVCLIEMGAPGSVSMTFSIVLGLGAMIGVAFLVRGLLGLQASGNINYREALGQYADVYLTIPPKGGGQGKITLALGGALSQYDAVTDDENGIRTGEIVRVTDIIHDSILVVEREKAEMRGV